MAQDEKYHERDLIYSIWHRRESTRRFIGIEYATLLAMIDLDMSLYVEYDHHKKDPIALIETARDIGQSYKTTTVTLNLAKRANLPCYVVLYKPSENPNPADIRYQDIESFRVKRLHPNPLDPNQYPGGHDNDGWITFSPDEWTEHLLRLRRYLAAKIDREFQELINTGATI